MMTSSGALRSRISPISSVEPRTLTPAARHAALARVVVHEPDRAGAEVRVELQLADDHLAAGAGADDQHAAACGARRVARSGRSAIIRRASRAPPSRKTVSRKSKTTTERGRLYAYGFASMNTATRSAAGDRGGPDERPQVGELEVAPPLAVQAEDARRRSPCRSRRRRPSR